MKQLRERLQVYGSQTLLTEELVAIILGTGTPCTDALELARKLLAKYGGLCGLLQADFGELNQEHGLGKARTSLLKATLEVGRRLGMPSAEEKYQIISPADAARLVMPDMTYLEYEQLRVIVLDTKNRVRDNIALYRGTISSSVLRVAEIFRPAIIRNCPGVIICHNHPSGDPKPTEEDLEANKQLVTAGQVLDIDVVDHLIIGHHQFVSLKERLRW